jgi:uncharacterized protein
VLLLSSLFAVGLVAGIFDTLVGGGGLITLPALLMTGMPAHLALGTNKLQGTFGSGSATLHFVCKERKTLKQVGVGIVSTAIGALIGVLVVLHINTRDLNQYIPPILLIVLIYALFSKRTRTHLEHPARMPYLLFMLLLGLMLGGYDAILGPGVGTFWTASLVAFLGFSIRKATIYTKVFNFTSNFFSLMVFILAHQVVYTLGLTMAAGQFLGGQIGGHLVLKQGHRIIRPLFISLVSILLISLSYKTYFVGHISL